MASVAVCGFALLVRRLRFHAHWMHARLAFFRASAKPQATFVEEFCQTERTAACNLVPSRQIRLAYLFGCLRSRTINNISSGFAERQAKLNKPTLSPTGLNITSLHRSAAFPGTMRAGPEEWAMPRMFRIMKKDDDDKPTVGQTAMTLGVRPGEVDLSFSPPMRPTFRLPGWSGRSKRLDYAAPIPEKPELRSNHDWAASFASIIGCRPGGVRGSRPSPGVHVRALGGALESRERAVHWLVEGPILDQRWTWPTARVDHSSGSSQAC